MARRSTSRQSTTTLEGHRAVDTGLTLTQGVLEGTRRWRGGGSAKKSSRQIIVAQRSSRQYWVTFASSTIRRL
jgi:hypothetical protein